jgi:hypothetical protein
MRSMKTSSTVELSEASGDFIAKHSAKDELLYLGDHPDPVTDISSKPVRLVRDGRVLLAPATRGLA